MAEMTGGQALARSLKVEGVETIFGLPGAQLDWAFSALYEERDSIRVVHTRHEQATAYMADGYARTTGRPGVALVVPGPGLLNAAAGLSTAYACNSPVFCVAGQVNSRQIDQGIGVLHEIKDQLGMIGSVTKWAGRAMTPEEAPALVHEGFRQMLSGRVRPVEIEIPQDVLERKGEVRLLEPFVPTRARVTDTDALERAAKLLGEARSPLIWAGGGINASGAWEELRQLAEMLQAPVVASANGRGAISDHHPLAQVQAAGRVLLPKADVILIAGSRFARNMRQPFEPTAEQTLIQLDIDPEEMARSYAGKLPLIADAKEGLAQLIERVGRYNTSRPSRAEEAQAVRARSNALYGGLLPQAAIGAALRQELPEDGILVADVTQMGFWTDNAFPVYHGRTYLNAGYQGTLGYAFSTALGAKVGNPDKAVVTIMGDGGFGYQIGELATMKHHTIGVVAIVFNDGAYGNVRRIQKQRYNEQYIATELTNPDYVKLAESFGIAGYRAKDVDELRLHLRDALSANAPALIELPLGEVPPHWDLKQED